MQELTIATRGSRLALWQAEYVKAKLLQINPDLNIKLSIIKTKGDIIQDVALAKVGGKGLFVKEIEEALLAKTADLAVHSIKDVPMVLPDGLLLGCIPKREVPWDCFLSLNYPSLKDLPLGARVGTSSLRRQAQLKAWRSDLEILSLRGNVDTRLRKLKEGQFEAIILAEAGLKRLGLSAPYEEELKPQVLLPAVGQGALGLECREDAYEVLVLLAELEDRDTRVCVQAERALLRGLNGSCQVPIAGFATLQKDEELKLTGLVAEVDGSKVILSECVGPAHAAEELGLELAQSLLEQGGKEILAKLLTNMS
ncbi:MAG: hydroxymethylbilane synthase [Desulfovibrionaceae bacterium]|nr:hydroxymethylbilane synthase [Desulfovibrionaceae bacterium]